MGVRHFAGILSFRISSTSTFAICRCTLLCHGCEDRRKVPAPLIASRREDVGNIWTLARRISFTLPEPVKQDRCRQNHAATNGSNRTTPPFLNLQITWPADRRSGLYGWHKNARRRACCRSLPQSVRTVRCRKKSPDRRFPYR